MTAMIDRDITIQHETAKANFASNGRPVSDLYLWKNYRALVLENARLLAQPEPEPDAADFNEDEQAMFLMATGRL